MVSAKPVVLQPSRLLTPDECRDIGPQQEDTQFRGGILIASSLESTLQRAFPRWSSHFSVLFPPPPSNPSVHISASTITFHRHIHPRAGGSVPVGFRRLADSGTNRVYVHKQIARQHSGSVRQVRLATCLLPKDRTPSLIASSPSDALGHSSVAVKGTQVWCFPWGVVFDENDSRPQ